MKTFLLGCTLFLGSMAYAAQNGSVVIKDAKIHEFPKSDSKVLESLSENAKVVVSNQPTEGFYKIRTSLGQMGWISGQEILVATPTSPPQPPTASPAPPVIGALPTPAPIPPRARSRKKIEIEEDEEGSHANRMRFLVGYGLANLSYAGLTENFTGVSRLNYGTTLQFEMQKKIGELLYWAARVETMSTSSGNVTLTNGNIPCRFNWVLCLARSMQKNGDLD
jgi:uncharacterized protein YgiM (DUF1202 family)